MIQQMVQNILVYVVIMAVLKGLVTHEGFQEIFRFVSGMILILLFASPLLSLFSDGSRWYEELEDNIFQMDRQQMKQELQVADGSFEDILVSECENEMKKQITKLAEDAGQIPADVEVKMRYKEGIPEIAEVKMILQDEEAAEQVSSERVVQKIVIDGGEKAREEKRRTDGQTRDVKRKICRKYELKKEAVEVWKISGKDSLQN